MRNNDEKTNITKSKRNRKENRKIVKSNSGEKNDKKNTIMFRHRQKKKVAQKIGRSQKAKIKKK